MPNQVLELLIRKLGTGGLCDGLPGSRCRLVARLTTRERKHENYR